VVLFGSIILSHLKLINAKLSVSLTYILNAIGVREGIFQWKRKKIVLKITIYLKNKQFALKLNF